jgi:hypothetical protein
VNRIHIASLVGVAAAALLLPSSAEAKYKIWLTVEPSRPIAGHPARVLVRTEVALPRRHGLRLHVIGPWREKNGQGFIEGRLVRIGSRTFQVRLRFPYAGRWRLIVPNWGPAPGSAFPPPVDRAVSVRP